MGNPKALLRKIVSWILLRIFRTRVTIKEESARLIRHGRTLIVANHVSFLDGLLIVIASPAPLVVAVDTDYSVRNSWTAAGMRFLSWLGYGLVVPLDQTSPFGIRRLKRKLEEGFSVLLFPEGKISPDGNEQPYMSGMKWLISSSSGINIVWARITGAEKSRLFAKSGKQLWPKITVNIGS